MPPSSCSPKVRTMAAVDARHPPYSSVHVARVRFVRACGARADRAVHAIPGGGWEGLYEAGGVMLI